MNVLFLTHRLPYAPNRGDRIRAYYLLREMAGWADVSLFSLVHDDDEEARAGSVPFAATVVTARVPRVRNHIRGALRVGTSRPLTHSLLDAPDAVAAIGRLVESRRPDVVLASSSGMARFAMAPPVDGLPFVLDMVDVDSEKWRALAARASFPRRWIYAREARTLAAFEREASRHARAVLVVSAPERASLLALAPEANVVVVPNGVDVEAFGPSAPPAKEPVVVFTGMMNYEPNVEAVAWFIRDVWPLVRRERPDATFDVVGANPPRALETLVAGDASIALTGRVDAVQPYLSRAAVAVAPLRTARGLQNKVLEALAAGLPVVITPRVSAGLPAGVERGCVVAREPGDFARALVQLLDQRPEERRQLAARSGIDALSWSTQLAPLRAAVEEAAS